MHADKSEAKAVPEGHEQRAGVMVESEDEDKPMTRHCKGQPFEAAAPTEEVPFLQGLQGAGEDE